MDTAENPIKFTGIRLSKPKKVAAGLPAVVSSMRHILEEMNAFRGMKALLQLNQKKGFDCPGCAWPDPDDERSPVAEYCENGAKAIAEEATTKKLHGDFFAQHTIEELGQLTDYEIGKKGRIAEPVYLAPGSTNYVPISWDKAYELIANRLNNLSSPNEAVFYTSGRTSNEAAFLYQLMVRQYGTNNLPDCSNMCHESSGVALTAALGIGKGSVTLEDVHDAEVIIILGQNPGTNHPRMLTALQKAKDKGAIIIAVNPIPETGLISFLNPQTIKGILNIPTPLTDLFLQVKINGDMALLKALSILLLEKEKNQPGSVFDSEFIENNTRGYQEYIAHLEELDLASLIETCGVPLEQLAEAAKIIAGKQKIIACWAMGLTQHKNAVDTIREVVNLLLLKGSIGKQGAGVCPVRGHSNVQGDRTMGIYEKPSDVFLDRLDTVFNIQSPRAHGYDVVQAIHAMHDGRAKVFIAMGGNFLSATPDTNYTAQALRNCDLTVHVSTKLNRSHLVHGKEAIILPCLGRSDKDIVNGEQQFVSCENSMGVVQSSRGNLHPVSDLLKSEPTIVCELATAIFGTHSPISWNQYMQHYDRIRDAIAQVIPGFEDYNLKVRHPGGFYLPNGAREGRFNTHSGKANFNIAEVTFPEVRKGEYLMMTIRSHDQFNTTIYGLNDRYRGVYNERRVVFMNSKDIEHEGLKSGQLVDLYNYEDGKTRVAPGFIVIPYDIPIGCTATYFPETNVLVPVNSVADQSNTPVSKSVIIQIKSSTIKS
ncbi:hypothetical protein DVR12_25100 [Chitinophaga silvatica]|uniref:Oxidoreductase alpha (Molybdopterin) subunit n=1 Tax=Chitinophaga silvatica TaxID=2282649 RepID=A0A3E1Y336_9BACT|nr:FdhF/YdeP family oxidoreductase [Chitinophaga silvatica]RFS19088.1 hypothetical protein DVR12_25100 [Chitinophaga silvatica]